MKSPTFIYGLIDPLTSELRYVGKTVKLPKKRLTGHLAAAKRTHRKRHVLAWAQSLVMAGRAPVVETLEIVPPGGDWIEAESFWIAYMRALGCDLCNLTIGGDGAPGRVHSPEERLIRSVTMKAVRAARGYVPMPQHVRAALAEGRKKAERDPEWAARIGKSREARMSPEKRARRIARLHAVFANPDRHAAREQNRRAALANPEVREKIGAASKANWAAQRDEIIAAQNAGKGESFRRKQAVARRALWADPEYRRKTSEAHAKALTAEDVRNIKLLIADGARTGEIAKRFDVRPDLISHIKSGRIWKHI